MSWPPGTIVACVDDTGQTLTPTVIAGQYYTIRKWWPWGNSLKFGCPPQPCVYLNEVVGHSDDRGVELAFRASRFRIAETKLNEIVMHHAKARP